MLPDIGLAMNRINENQLRRQTSGGFGRRYPPVTVFLDQKHDESFRILLLDMSIRTLS